MGNSNAVELLSLDAADPSGVEDDDEAIVSVISASCEG